MRFRRPSVYKCPSFSVRVVPRSRVQANIVVIINYCCSGKVDGGTGSYEVAPDLMHKESPPSPALTFTYSESVCEYIHLGSPVVRSSLCCQWFRRRGLLL